MSGCADSSNKPALPEQTTRLVYPDLPPTQCARNPLPPQTDSDADWDRYKATRDDAGDDCRAKLDAVDATVKTWPHGVVREQEK